MDGLIYHGRWNVIGGDFPVPSIPFPNFKVESGGEFYVLDVEGHFIDLATPHEVDLLDYQFSRASLGFQDAFEALHGFGEWQDHFDKLTPAYAKARITRPLS
jgi:hypothetical protein